MGVNVAVMVAVPTPFSVAVGVEELAKLATEVLLEEYVNVPATLAVGAVIAFVDSEYKAEVFEKPESVGVVLFTPSYKPVPPVEVVLEFVITTSFNPVVKLLALIVPVIVVPETTETLVSDMPPIVRVESQVKLAPLIVTETFPETAPVAGEIDETVGALA